MFGLGSTLRPRGRPRSENKSSLSGFLKLWAMQRKIDQQSIKGEYPDKGQPEIVDPEQIPKPFFITNHRILTMRVP
jgi:hypothetical protein